MRCGLLSKFFDHLFSRWPYNTIKVLVPTHAEQEALLLQRDRATGNVTKFVLLHDVCELERFQAVKVTQGHWHKFALRIFDRPHTISY